METQNQDQNLRQRVKDEPTATTTNEVYDESAKKGRNDKRTAMAKRGLKTLAVAVSFPLSLTLLDIYFFGSSKDYKMTNKPSWVPPIWALHMACLATSILMGLCGWMVWAEGGFHKKPRALPIYLGAIGLGLLWDPLVFRLGTNLAGLVVAVAVSWALVMCSNVFRQVNQIAGDLVLPCLGWSGLLAFVNLRFLFA